jgi:hypothetical protein
VQSFDFSPNATPHRPEMIDAPPLTAEAHRTFTES